MFLTQPSSPAPPEGKDIEKMVEEYEGASARRTLTGPVGLFVAIVAGLFALFYLYQSKFGIISPEANRGIYVGITVFLCLLLYPASKKSPRDRITVLDGILALLAVVVTVYFVINYGQMANRIGFVTTPDLIMGLIAIVLCIEATRRVTGNVLAVIAVIFVIYALFGPYFPGILSHKGFTLHRVAGFLFSSLYGIFGGVAAIFANFVFMFMLFGTFLEFSGAGKFFIDFPYSLLGRARGGPAKVAIVASGLMGSINGSAAANVVTTGTFTIPLMKRVGYKPHMAGAIEAVASTGGMLMPPIMGAGAFVMSEFTGISYWHIALVSFVPAVLYYMYLYLMVDYQARNLGLSGLPKSELPDPRHELKQGWYYLLPVAVVIYLLVNGYSPGATAFWGIVGCVALSWVRKDTRMGLKEIGDALVKGTVQSLTVGATVGTIGIIVGVVYLTGLALKFSSLLLALSGGILPVAILLVGVAAYVLGMGITATTSYVILAVLAVPALQELGVEVLAAHLIVYWMSLIGNINPPVCLAAFAGAAIAQADPMKTGWTAVRFGQPLYIIPFLFAYTPILFNGPTPEVIRAIAGAFLGIYMVAGFTQGYQLRKLNWVERILAGISAVLLCWPDVYTDIMGFVLMIMLLLWQMVTIRRQRAGAADIKIQ